MKLALFLSSVFVIINKHIRLYSALQVYQPAGEGAL